MAGLILGIALTVWGLGGVLTRRLSVPSGARYSREVHTLEGSNAVGFGLFLCLMGLGTLGVAVLYCRTTFRR